MSLRASGTNAVSRGAGSLRADPVSPVPKVKGSAFRTNLAVLEELGGPETVAEALGYCSEDLSLAVRFSALVVGGWYPIAWYRELLSAIARIDGSGLESIRKYAKLTADRDIKGVYRALAKLLTASTVISLYGQLFPKYYSHGGIVVEHSEAGYVRIRLTGCLGFDHNMFVELCAGSEHLMTLTGAKNVHARLVNGGQDGSGHATIEGRWTKS